MTRPSESVSTKTANGRNPANQKENLQDRLVANAGATRAAEPCDGSVLMAGPFLYKALCVGEQPMSSWSRRNWLQACAGGLAGASATAWFPAMAQQLAADPRRRRHAVLLWMTGGPSQTDTFDMKPGHVNGGEFREIATSVPGLRFSEHLPRLAQQAAWLAPVRSVRTREGDHERGTYAMRTGHPPGGSVRYPTIGASLSKELARERPSSVDFVSIAPYRAFSLAAYGPGFLGPRYAPLTVGANDAISPVVAPPNTNNPPAYAELTVDDLQTRLNAPRFRKRIEIWNQLQTRFLHDHVTASPRAQDTVYRRALELMDSDLARAFDLSTEPTSVRDAYGRGRFGQGCLLTRRLIERGVPFIEISLGPITAGSLGWDTHAENFKTVRDLSAELDQGWATLMHELAQRSLLDSTTFLWMGEFGRTPVINGNAGRDHFPNAWTCVFAGGGIRGGEAYGRTSPDGMEVVDQPVSQADLLATFCAALGIDPSTENTDDQARPIRIAEGTPIRAILS